MLNVRLDKKEEKKLKEYSTSKNISKTSMVKEALAMYYKSHESEKTPYEVGEDLFGTHASGNSNNSSEYKSKIKEKLHEKYSH